MSRMSNRGLVAQKYAFDVELIFEPSFDAMRVYVEYESGDPEAVMNGDLGMYFEEYILQNLSIVFHGYEEVD